MSAEQTLTRLCNDRGFHMDSELLCDNRGNRFYEIYIYYRDGQCLDVYTSHRSAEDDEYELLDAAARRAIKGIKETEIE